MTARTDRIPGVGVVEARELLDAGAEMIDVRSDHEWAAGRCLHSVHVPMRELSDATTWLSRAHPLIVVSRSGRRAAEAVTHLKAAGLDAVRLEGGLHAWRDAGGELTSGTSRPARLI
ncbi:MAG TPA: rhodanese-like domain-containing protein [Candidatus Nanopelagicales bacterium]|nr:rhodanese-like domain-containing protein [Candidatus Nanopelagicales bacterium]